ncbi:unnamed protein product [Cuscuta europaea]|uniref:Uncharacterized protein n=1 Tax=Cuscuta europaea TaxID=41803 RepID=A0A9P0YNJ6_CUSEU|nr:unnamed protein product [Cuscuta europaea]
MGGRRGVGGEGPSWPPLPPLPPLDRKSSIESEPPTLSGDQIQVARGRDMGLLMWKITPFGPKIEEAALCVMNNASVEEAARIFTEGLEAVVSCVHDDDRGGEKRTRTFILDYRDDDEQQGHQAPIAPAPPFREIATAPF